MRSRSVARTQGQLQPRLVTPIGDRLRPSDRGDVLISLSRGLAGKRTAAVKVAHSLELHKWGDQRLCLVSQDEILGQAREIAHLVTVTYLPEVIEAVSIRRSRTDIRSGVNETKPGLEFTVSEASGPYDVEGTHGYFQRLKEDEYLHVERQSNGRYSVMWSTDATLRSFLYSVVDVLPAPRENDQALWLVSDEEEREGLTQVVLKSGPKMLDEARLLSAHFPGTTAYWRRPFRKLQVSKVKHAEAAFVYDLNRDVDQGQLYAAIRATGSPVVRRLLETEPTLLADILQV